MVPGDGVKGPFSETTAAILITPKNGPMTPSPGTISVSMCYSKYQNVDLRKTRGMSMETWYYTVVSIDGDYATLKRTDIESENLKLVARAILQE